MTTITIITAIQASKKDVFNAARNINLHIESTSNTNETAIAGKTSGCIGLNETVTWRAKHFGIYLTHQSKITQMQADDFFIDTMIKGHFTHFEHLHFFKALDTQTIMTDILYYEVPCGFIGKTIDLLVLKKHLIHLLYTRNQHLKKHLENRL